MTEPRAQAFHFFLGGNDLEMTTIRDMLEANGQTFDDAKLAWGAKASSYGDRIQQIAETGAIPVLIELELDQPLPKSAVVVDHHGADAHKPASILQVAELLGVEPTRDQALVAANDAGYINGMRDMGATQEEIAAIRKRDRDAQGITPEQEAEAMRAIEARDASDDQRDYTPKGMVVVRCAHSKTAPICDHYRALEDGGPKSILMISDDGEVNYSGPGDVAQELATYFPEKSWSGGAGLGNPEGEAFFGMPADEKEATAVFAVAIASHVMNGHSGISNGKHGPNFLTFGPWVDHSDPWKTTPFEGAFYAVEIAKETGCAAPIKYWLDKGGSVSDFHRRTTAAEREAKRGLDRNAPDFFEQTERRLSKMDLGASGYARTIGLDGEAMALVKAAAREEAIKREAQRKHFEAAMKGKDKGAKTADQEL